MKVAITGSTGSLGGALITALAGRIDVTRIVALSRDEVKSGDLADRWDKLLPSIRCMLGDVRDQPRLEEVFRGCDAVIHAAALKRISHSVYSPGEMVKTNIQGTINAIQAAAAVGVARVLVVSSDKCAEPVNLYGVTKCAAECYAVQSNSYTWPRGTRVGVVRYGNVLGSRGSVVGVWREQLRRGLPLTITDPAMTRFIITLQQAAAFCLAALEDMEGGEVFVPRLPAARVADLADAVENEWYARRTTKGEPCWSREITGLRPGGEKLHEALLTREEPTRTWWDGGRMVILPSHHSWREDWTVPEGQQVAGPYTSDAPDRWLTVEELIAMLKEVP